MKRFAEAIFLDGALPGLNRAAIVPGIDSV